MSTTLRDQCVKQDGLYHIFDIAQHQLPATPKELIQNLAGPTVLHINGKGPGCRVITTLIHGDEPHALRAVLAQLREGNQPAVNIKIVIIAVDAAALPPVFSHAFCTGKRDLNRCFREPFLYQQSHIIHALLCFLEREQPAAMLDLRDSAPGVTTFAMANSNDPAHLILTSYFCDLLVSSPTETGAITNIPLSCPVVSLHAPADYAPALQTALLRSLAGFWCAEQLTLQQDVQVIANPRRLELRRSAAITYSDRPVFGVNCTLRSDIEQCSFVTQQPGDVLGWVDHSKLEHFRVAGRSNREKARDFFSADDNCLTVTQPLTLFMTTKNSDLAKSDCLFYFATE